MVDHVYERAGWWRRTMGLLLDYICVVVPSAVLGSLLFASTAGYLQWGAPGLQWETCALVTPIPATLDPPPPADSNGAVECQDYSVAGQVGRTLNVTRTTRDKGAVTSVGRTYALQTSGKTGGLDLSWVTEVALLALLVGFEWRFGTTPGKRLLGMRVVDIRDPERRGVPLKRVAIRYGVAIAGVLIPAGLGLGIVLVPVALGGSPSGFAWFMFVLLLALSTVWQIWNLVRIVKRRPAVYDQLAGLEIVRARPRAPVFQTVPS